MEKEEIWQAVLAHLQLTTSPANFATWFKDTKIVSLEGGKAVISVANSFVKEWLEQKYQSTILKILRGLNCNIKDLEFQVGKIGLKIVRKPSLPASPAYEVGQLEFPEFEVDKRTNLNPRYTFANFVVGSFNELAHAAALAVVKNPGEVYNPLFIYGGVGLGKTHLLEATGNEIVKQEPQKKVIYFPCEKFISDVINAIKNHQIEKLKSFYQNFDVLIIDDVQFLAGKEKTQEEFFYIFNSLYEKNKQIVISSDRPPKAIPSLTERLRSRFEGGMIADISYPDFETRLVILKTKSQERGINLSEEILNYIASNIKRNIRELEGALNILVAYQKTQGKAPDFQKAKILLKNIITPANKIITAKKIIKTVAEFYDLRENQLLTNTRRREVVKPRQIAMFLIREELKGSFPFIARRFGGKDHTTVIHSCEKIKKEMEKDEALKEEIKLIKEKIFTQ
jgi:chromosomal replication initiator protein